MRRSAEGHESGDCNSYDCPICEYEYEIAREAEAALKAAECDVCGAPCRGPVDTIDGVPAHYCRQCAEHCALTRYLHEREVKS